METKKGRKKMDKNDHAGIKTGAKIVRGVLIIGGALLSVISGTKSLLNRSKKS